jgi:phage repressor protein C with HTH and peptisase S24 domain
MEHINIPALPFKADGYSFYGQKESIGKSPGWQPDYANTLMNVLYTKAYPYPVNTVAMGVHPDSMYNKYNIFASAWVNVRNKRVSSINKPKLFARRMLEVNGQASFLNEDGEYEAWTGFQGGYLLRAQNANYTIDFVNVLYVSGVPFIFDCANQASNTPASVQWEEDQLPYEEFKYGETNFAPGDKLILSTTGGALGLPAPGAKVRIKVGGEPKNPNQFEDEDLEEIQVVPNPYFISHQGQKSPYGAELYFTRLPETCTIDVYTVTGELIKRIEHNEITSTDPNKVSVDIWDLLSDNNQRVASQALVAVISTPNGAQTIKNFSVIVGSYRIITD